jgi:hypothetical protein
MSVGRQRKPLMRRPAYAVDDRVAHEFAMRGLVPPHCTPENLARALERERQITIVFQPHESSDLGVYGAICRKKGSDAHYVIVFRPTYSIVLQRLTLFHELAHLLFRHRMTAATEIGSLHCHRVSEQDDGEAEAFAVRAMQYSFLDTDGAVACAEADDDLSASVFGQFLQQTRYFP